MARFGGWSHFGGLSQFGGDEARAQLYYRLLKSTMLPGFWPQDDALLINRFLRMEAEALGHGQLHVDRLNADLFPHTTGDDSLADWESFLGVVRKNNVLLIEARDAVVSRWRGGAGPTLQQIRYALYPLLNSATAFNDVFADGQLSSRYEINDAAFGTIVESVGALDISVAATVDGNWDTGGGRDGPLIGKQLVDLDDGYTTEAQITSNTIGVDTAAGIAIWDYDQTSAYALTLGDTGGGGVKLRCDRLEADVLTEDLDALGIAAPGVPIKLQMVRAGDQLSLYYAFPATDPFTLLGTITMHSDFVPRYWGAYARNATASKNAVTQKLAYLDAKYATPENNVEIVEQREVNADASGDESQIFFWFVHRRTADAGAYDLLSAQILMNRIKQGHVLALVGERAEAQCDDSESLCDRDICGT